MTQFPTDVFPIRISIDPPTATRSTYEFKFNGASKAPDATIYFTKPKSHVVEGLFRRVGWEIIGSVPDKHHLMIIPKAFNSQMFHGPFPPGMTNQEKEDAEKHRLDGATPQIISNGALRGPQLNIADLRWYYELTLFKGEPKISIASYPPTLTGKGAGEPVAYIDPVVIIKDDEGVPPPRK